MQDFLRNQATKDWVAQFPLADQPHAIALLKAMLLVSRDEFDKELRKLLTSRIVSAPGPVAVFVEREIRKQNNIPDALFKRSRRRPRRAEGPGPNPVQTQYSTNRLVGSEGIVAQLASQVVRSTRNGDLFHPSPNQIRSRKVKRFIIVTDLIASGKRVVDYLRSLWKVESVRSWVSLGLVRFEVVAYSATENGAKLVRGHKSSPLLHYVSPCPTLATAFSKEKYIAVAEVCERNNPNRRKSKYDGLGYGQTGALIAFGHGVPNNAPRVLHGRSSSWAPLFPTRVTATMAKTFGRDNSEMGVRQKLAEMKELRLSRARWSNEDAVQNEGTARELKMILVLAAYTRPPRKIESASSRTGLPILEVQEIIDSAKNADWIGDNGRLTDAGHRQLNHLRKSQPNPSAKVANEEKPFYYPKSLRAI